MRLTNPTLCLLWLFFCIRPTFGQEPISVELVLELSSDDNLTVDHRIIENRCSRLLANRKDHATDKVIAALRARGLAYFRMRNVDAAKTDFDELCAMRPKDSECRVFRAAALLVLKHFDQAADEARTAIRLDPKKPGAHVVLGMVSWHQGNRDAAWECYDRAIDADNLHASAYYIRGASLVEFDPTRALHSLNRFLDLSPYDAEEPARPYYLRGICLLSLNRPKEALASLLLALKLSPGSSQVAQGIAKSYADMAKFHLAAHYADRVIADTPDAPTGYALAADFYSMLGNATKTNRAIEKLLTFSSHDPLTLYIVGKAHFQLGRYDLASRFLDNGLKAAPAHLRCLIGKASLLSTCPDVRFRNGAEALRFATRAYDDGSLPKWQKWEAAMTVADAYAELGNYATALLFCNEALDLAGVEFGRRSELLAKRDLFRKGMPYRAKTKADPRKEKAEDGNDAGIKGR